MEALVFAREKQPIEICGRTFLLEEMSGEEVSLFHWLEAEAVTFAVDALDEEKATPEEAERRISAAWDERIALILRQPTDDRGRAGPDLLSQITERMRCRLVEIQDGLNSI